MIKSKKAQIAETITWFIAFIIVFFIIMIFSLITIIYSSLRQAEILEYQSIIISNNQKEIFSILDLKVNQDNKEVYLKDLIRDYYNAEGEDRTKKSLIEKTFEDNLKDYYYRIEIFKVVDYQYGDIIKKDGGQERPIYLNQWPPDYGGLEGSFNLEIIELSKKNEIYLINTKKVKINYWIQSK